MPSGIEIYNADGSLNMSNDDLTTFVLGTRHISLLENITIQHDYLIGKNFWYTVLSYDTVPVGQFNKGLGMGYYLPDLTFDSSSGTASFIWNKNYYDIVMTDKLTKDKGLSLRRIGFSGFTIIYGGM